ncbi:MerR family transcriptional regulator [Roseivirga sp.]|uniref:MerR family transcriptional regulator n=1 Tax=Roseivirga sp. TaxID=1964215 RepID=UPI002B27B429|nr:MerR family transcriptional regulator [Roseivirga sp.]
MVKYSVKQLSKLASVTAKTLHHYDAIGILKPAERAESGYRYYGKSELLRLQQILFYKELDYPLEEIKHILDQPDFDLVESLERHRNALLKRTERLSELLNTIDKTIQTLKSKDDMISDEEMYAGFSKEEVPQIRQEVTDRWGKEQLEGAEKNIRQMDKSEWSDTKQEAEEINRWLVNLMHLDPTSVEVQRVVFEHFKHLNKFYKVKDKIYRGLGEMYTEDERFKMYYDAYKEGLAVFLNDAIQVFCDNGLKVES